MNRPQRWFTIMLWAIVIISLSGEAWQILTVKNNLPFFHTYILIEYLLLIQVFKNIFRESVKKRIWWLLSLGFVLIWVFNVTIGEGWWVFPDYIHILEAIIILIFISIWFLKMLREKEISNPEQTFEFWMCTGLLVFFSGNFLLFVFTNFLLKTDMAVYEAIWKVHCILIILLYILYTVALLWVKKTIK